MWRIWYKFFTPKVDLHSKLSKRHCTGNLVSFIKKKQTLKNPTTFDILNKTYNLLEIGWDGRETSKLWRYNQHYFDDLNAKNSFFRRKWHQDLISNWIEKNNVGEGTGWEPYPTSLRIVNWIKWGLKNNKHNNIFLQSLVIQARWLNKKIEWHLLGNHLFANAKALIFAGFFFTGKEAEGWLYKGWKIALEEMSEQILSDGGHFELSTMYHSIFLEDILDIINIMNKYPKLVDNSYHEICVRASIKMMDWLQKMSHPDGEISFFNDSSIGIAQSPNELKLYAKKLGIKSSINKKYYNNLSYNHLKESGYISLQTKNLSIFLDVAKIGPEYLPGHGHADILSFEMSMFSKRFFVNGGTSEYDSGKIRFKERSTSSHNTVTINDQNSSQIWSSFRVAKRAEPTGLKIKKSNGCIFINCSHDGYKTIPGKPIHTRYWKINKNEIEIKDEIVGNFDFAKSHFHLHPDIKIEYIDECKWVLKHPDIKKDIIMTISEGTVKLDKSYYSPQFGCRLPTKCLTIQFTSSNVVVHIAWD